MPFTLLTLTQTGRFIAGLVAVWQVVGLLPLITWLADPSAITPMMSVTAMIKILVLVVSALAYFFLTKRAARINSESATLTPKPPPQKHAVPIGTAAVSLITPDTAVQANRSGSSAEVPLEPMATETETSDEALWAAAATEWHGAERRLGLWARLFAEAKGDENVAKASYLSARFAELKDRERQRRTEERAAEIAALRVAAAERLEQEAKALAYLPHWAKGTCPNCDVLMLISAPKCQTCGASFERQSGWRPKPLPVP